MRIVIIIFFLILNLNSSFGQIVFAPNESTQWNDRPFSVIEIPGGRYVFSISQEESISYSSTRMNGFVLITNSDGQVLHSRNFPSDTFHICRVSNIHFLNNHLYLNVTLGNDSLGQNQPIWAALIKMDTALNVINKWVYQIGDSSQYVYTNHSAVIGNVLYCLYGKALRFGSPNIIHPIIRAYDLNGVLLREKELDTSFFNAFPVGTDYTLIPLHIGPNFGSLIISAIAGKVQGSGVTMNRYLIDLDSVFSLKKAASVGCMQIACKSSLTMGSIRVIGLSDHTFLGGSAYDTGYAKKSALLKFDFSGPVPPPYTPYLPTKYTIVSDSPSGYKYPTVNNMSMFDNSAYYVDHTNFDPSNPLSTYKNRLIVSKCDTNAQIEWVKYIGGDAHYFPSNILATTDHGCLVLAYRYDSNVPTNQFDNYIFKLDGNGNFLNVQSLSIKNNLMELSPNPASEYLIVKTFQNEAGTFRIIDMSGRVLMSRKIEERESKIDISFLSPGLYSYYFQTDISKFPQTGLWIKK